MDLRITGQRVLVTGGAGGIGTACVKAFAAEGARIAIGYIGDASPADKLADTVRTAGGDALTLGADINDAAAVAAMFARLDDAWGGLDILINNAGVDGPRAEAWKSDPAAWSRVIDTNLKGAFLCAREALRRMVPARAGVVINTSSVHEAIAWSGYSAYAASKAAVSMMAKTLAQEAAPFGIRVLCVAPGAIETPINRPVWSDARGLADLVEKIPLGRLGRPEEVAAMMVILASPAASYVTGTTLYVDGGMTDYPSFAHGG